MASVYSVAHTCTACASRKQQHYLRLRAAARLTQAAAARHRAAPPPYGGGLSLLLHSTSLRACAYAHGLRRLSQLARISIEGIVKINSYIKMMK